MLADFQARLHDAVADALVEADNDPEAMREVLALLLTSTASVAAIGGVPRVQLAVALVKAGETAESSVAGLRKVIEANRGDA